MNTQQAVNDVYIYPGGVHFGDRNTRIRTLLGSCVSMVFWHPGLQVGGMCHFMLPGREMQTHSMDGRYADEAMELLMLDIDALGAPREQYQVKVFGGGDMFGSKGNDGAIATIGLKNIRAARSLIKTHGFEITGEHLGGGGHRVVVFEVWSGEVKMKYVPIGNPLTVSMPSCTTPDNKSFIWQENSNTECSGRVI